MKRTVLQILIGFLFLSCSSTQSVEKKNGENLKQYSFDYLIEYTKYYTDSASNETVYLLTNSMDNSYFVEVKSLDSLYFELEFIAQDNIWTTTKVTKKNFFKAEHIKFNCNSDLSYKNHFKFRAKEYEFEILPDTLLNNRTLKNYKLKYIGKRKRKKSFPIGTNLYIIKDSTEFHLPILTHSTAFEEWKEERNIPNGIFMEKIFYDFRDEINYKYILYDYYQISKSIIIPENCFEQ